MPKHALITGISGQDGSYLAELLLEKGYDVFGLLRRTAVHDTGRIDHLLNNPHFRIITGELTDRGSLLLALEKSKPDEVYNLAAMSFVGASWDLQNYCEEVNYLGVVRLLDLLDELKSPAKFYQASTSEMIGEQPKGTIADESTPFNPQSPYAKTKLKAHYAVQEAKKKGRFAVSGILFNHESPRRGLEFVTRKFTLGVARVKLGLQESISLGNLNAYRDWGFAGDYVKAMWMMLQQPTPEDYIIGTGISHSVREFIEAACTAVGIPIRWEGSGINEVGIRTDTNSIIVKVDPQFFRPSDVNYLHASSKKAMTVLGWKPTVSFEQLVKMMVDEDLKRAKLEAEHGVKPTY